MRFSIIMCTYNSALTLRYAIESVREQTYTDWELLILDNGSHDETVELLQAYCAADERISCIYRADNVGWCKGISICLKAAGGEYMMFLGADDLLARKETLQEVSNEIDKHKPDIVWTANAFATYEDGSFKIAQRTSPGYRVWKYRDDRIANIAKLMQETYYNSMMHYVRIDFLKKYEIDFFAPYYGDCQGMMEAMCRADKMVVMDSVEYILTINTSQTSQKVGFDYDMQRQWESVKQLLREEKKYVNSDVQYIAARILKNLAAMCEFVLLGVPLRNALMQEIERSFPERFLRAEEWISSDAFGEMMTIAGREEYSKRLLSAAGILYWECKRVGLAEEIKGKSRWLADFVECFFVLDNDDNLVMKPEYDEMDAEKLLEVLQRSSNPWSIGFELLVKEGIKYRSQDLRERVVEIWDNIQNRTNEKWCFDRYN